jgi:hypothetical protein
VLTLDDIDRPPPGEGEVLCNVAGSGVGPWDAKIRQGLFGPHEFPYVPGAEISGTVEAVGEGVTGFSEGDPVFGNPGMFGGYGGRNSNNNNSVPVWLIVLLVSVVTYFLSQILILAISRYREFAADRGSALITGAPEHLMSALQKISSEMFRIPQRDLREVESMNAFFIIPASVKTRTASLFATHPPLEQRLERLSEIAREMGRPVS